MEAADAHHFRPENQPMSINSRTMQLKAQTPSAITRCSTYFAFAALVALAPATYGQQSLKPITASEAVVVTKDQILSIINALSAEVFSKNGLETEAEYIERRKAYSSASSIPRQYRLLLDIDNRDNKPGMIQYDLERRILRVTMPMVTRGRYIAVRETKRKVMALHHSFLPIAGSGGYKGSRYEGNKIGLSFLGQAKWTSSNQYSSTDKYDGQEFEFAMTREDARPLLESGRIAIDMRLELECSSLDSHPILYVYNDIRRRAFGDSFDSNVEIKGLPMRLLAVSIVDANGKILQSQAGAEVSGDFLAEK